MAKILVLCVDRDDDLGAKANIEGPIIGKENNLKAATALIKVDPSESDANAIFEGVKVLKELKKEGVDIITLTGHPSRGYRADKKILSQLDAVLKKYEKLDGVYLVTDGADDDQVIPVINSRIRIVSKKTLIVRQAKELEKSYYVIKQLLRDPHFARIIFGLPGLILLAVAFLAELGFKIIILAIGVYLILKGFGAEEPLLNAVRSFKETTSIERASFPLYIGSLFTFMLSIWAGLEKFTGIQEANLVKQGAAFINGFIILFLIAIILFLIARVGDMHHRKEVQKIRKYFLSIVTISAICLVISRTADLISGTILLDEFIGWIIFAFIGSIVGISIVKRVYLRRYIIPKLKKGLEVFSSEGNKLGILLEVGRKAKHITVQNEKQEKMKVPFSRIVLVKDFVAVRL